MGRSGRGEREQPTCAPTSTRSAPPPPSAAPASSLSPPSPRGRRSPPAAGDGRHAASTSSARFVLTGSKHPTSATRLDRYGHAGGCTSGSSRAPPRSATVTSAAPPERRARGRAQPPLCARRVVRAESNTRCPRPVCGSIRPVRQSADVAAPRASGRDRRRAPRWPPHRRRPPLAARVAQQAREAARRPPRRARARRRAERIGLRVKPPGTAARNRRAPSAGIGRRTCCRALARCTHPRRARRNRHPLQSARKGSRRRGGTSAWPSRAPRAQEGLTSRDNLLAPGCNNIYFSGCSHA